MKLSFLLSLITFIFLYESISTGDSEPQIDEKKMTYSGIINKDYV